MKIKLEGIEYDLNLSKVVEHNRALYQQLKNDGIKLDDGTTFIFSGNSVIKTAIKMIMTPFIIPALKKIYKARGLELPPPVKHEDLIDYSMNSILNFIAITEQTLYADVTTEINENSNGTIKSVITTWESARLELPEQTEKRTEG